VVSEVKTAGQKMPTVAQWVADLRQAVGTERIDAALRAGQQARREYERISAERGPAAADAWHRRQTFPHGCFWAAEAGHTVGLRRAEP
jgi:hypothetical protein